MDRPIIYTQEQGRSVDFLFAQRAAMIGLGKLAQAAFGSNTVVRGLAVTPNSPAALNVLVGIGEIYTTAVVDATTYGSLPADTTDQIIQQGLNMAAQTISTPAPTTSGFSIAYLIEAQFQSQDTTTLVPPFFNSSNPQQPLNGQGGNGATLPTERQGVCVIQAKAGIAATTGTQVTPSVDSGWTALAVVTVANGATTVVAGNISVPAGVPQVTSILQMMQTESTNYALDTSGTANQINIALTPPITAYTDGMQLNFRAANNSNNAVNINAGPGNISLSGAAGALQSGEIVAGGYYTAVYQSNSGTAVLVGQGAGAEQVNPATQSKHAARFRSPVNTGRLLNVQAFTSSGTYTPTAGTNSIIVEVQAGGGGSGGIAAQGSGVNGTAIAAGAGAYAKVRYLSTTTQTVTVGAGGTAGAAGINNGGFGGNSSFGSLVVCPGGNYGGASAGGITTFAVVGGASNTALPTVTGTAEILSALAGQGSSIGFTGTGGLVGYGAAGASSFFGTGGQNSVGGVGGAGTGYGSGAGASTSAASTAARAGAAGAPGIVIVYEYA